MSNVKGEGSGQSTHALPWEQRKLAKENYSHNCRKDRVLEGFRSFQTFP